MRLKSLLLGSAAAFAAVGGAQAADLSVAEPVDYVRVCDAFGTGYWYIPGTDTCLKIWGFVRLDVNLYPSETSYGYQSYGDTYYSSSIVNVSSSGSFVGTFASYYSYYSITNSSYTSSQYAPHYDFRTLAYFSMSAKSMTDWGPLEGFLAGVAWTSWESDSGVGWLLDEAYLSLGPLKAGFTGSLFNFQFPYQLDPDGGWYQSQHKADVIQLSWAMNGFGLGVALEEPNVSVYDHQSSMPDIIAAISASAGIFDAKVSFVYSDYADGAWAVQAGVVVKLDSIAAGDRLLLKAAYGDASYYVTNQWASGTNWSAIASFIHYWAPNLSSSATFNYADGDGYNGAWQAAFNFSYAPVPNLWLTPEIRAWGGNNYDTTWKFTFRIQRNFF